MIQSVENTPIYELLSTDSRVVYKIPPYQREYSWTKQQWDALFDDLVREDTDNGHFLGTIICLNSTQSATQASLLELIDGQQRMTTLSLLLLALYWEIDEYALDEEYDFDDEARVELSNLKRMLVLRRTNMPRLHPQDQNNNRLDYFSLLADAGIDVDESPADTPAHRGNRRVAKCFNHFRNKLRGVTEAESERDPVEVLFDFLEKVKASFVVKLEVNSASDAFTLFESLNNRGLPLTPIDLIKNTILAQTDRTSKDGVDAIYQRWTGWLRTLGDDYSLQERFFRHFYNAFKHDDAVRVSGHPVATRPKLIAIYDALIQRDLDGLVTRLDDAVATYSELLYPSPTSEDPFAHELRRLRNAQGAAAYMLLLAVRTRFAGALSLREYAHITADLISFFVRRNLTNYPPTYAIDRRFSELAEEIAHMDASSVGPHVRRKLRDLTAPDDEFLEALRGQLYEENVGTTRFILAELSAAESTRETRFDLWERREVGAANKLQYLWTIEHILPQGYSLPQSWIDMLGGEDEAWEAQQDYAHTLGNLTITGYNATLSNKGFLEKRDRTDSKGRPVGYKNGLPLNASLATSEKWTVEQIKQRTEELAHRTVGLFSLGDAS